MPQDDLENYEKWTATQKEVWDAKCTRCGACCGITEGDPCEHLLELDNGKYQCSIYENRFGLHKTRSGKTFCCVHIREILHLHWPGDQCCGYKKKN